MLAIISIFFDRHIQITEIAFCSILAHRRKIVSQVSVLNQRFTKFL